MDLKDRIEAFRTKAARADMARAAEVRHQQNIEDELNRLEAEMAVYTKGSEALKLLLEELTRENLDSVDRLVTQGLRRVFHDQVDITFKSELVDTRNQLQIQFKTEQGPASGKAVDSFGASVTVVESLLLRIIVVLKMGLQPVLLLDESLAQVSDHYVEPMGRLLHSLCQKMGLTVLLVTHQQGFQDNADVVYKADCKEDGDVRTLTLKKIKDEHGHPRSH
jgi:hypothetical protein